jgi:hypothetical protein
MGVKNGHWMDFALTKKCRNLLTNLQKSSERIEVNKKIIFRKIKLHLKAYTLFFPSIFGGW